MPVHLLKVPPSYQSEVLQWFLLVVHPITPICTYLQMNAHFTAEKEVE